MFFADYALLFFPKMACIYRVFAVIWENDSFLKCGKQFLLYPLWTEIRPDIREHILRFKRHKGEIEKYEFF